MDGAIFQAIGSQRCGRRTSCAQLTLFKWVLLANATQLTPYRPADSVAVVARRSKFAFHQNEGGRSCEPEWGSASSRFLRFKLPTPPTCRSRATRFLSPL